MHGQRYVHGDIAKRQGLLGGLVSDVLRGANPTQTPSSSNINPLGSILGDIPSALISSQPSETSSLPSISLTISPSSSSVFSTFTTSSSSVSLSSISTSSTFSSMSSATSTSSTASSTATPTPTLSSTVISSNGAPAIVTATVLAPSSSNASGATVSKSFFQNRPLEVGVFVVVSLIGAVLIIIVSTVWIRSSNRRKLNREALDFHPPAMYGFGDEERSSVEKLIRWNSTSSAGHTHTTAGQAGYGARFGKGDYPVPPLPLLNPMHNADDYGQPWAYSGQLPQGLGYNSEHEFVAYAPPRSPHPVYDPARPPTPPDQTIIALRRSDGSHIEDVNPILPANQNTPPQRRSSLLDSSSASSFASGEDKGNIPRRLSSYSRALNPGMQGMPIPPALPAKFRLDEEDGQRPYSGIANDDSIDHPLKVANE